MLLGKGHTAFCSRECAAFYPQSPKGKYLKYKQDAQRRGKTFNLTFEEFYALWQKPCVYCGEEIKTIGIDRIDNKIGYEPGNVVSCCSRCNYWKGGFSRQDFQDRCKHIYDFMSKCSHDSL